MTTMPAACLLDCKNIHGTRMKIEIRNIYPVNMSKHHIQNYSDYSSGDRSDTVIAVFGYISSVL